MTKTGNLLNTDLESLFSQYTIEEIEKLSQGLRHDIDHKREELRSMVGERYRDLMNAADTITQMKDSSESVIQTMNSIIQTTHDFQSGKFTRTVEFSLQNFDELDEEGRDQDDQVDEDDPLDDKMVSLAAQIKLLTDSPEKMWSAVEQADFLLAAQLYLFARHVHTSLTMNDFDGQLSAGFPVIDRQWNAIAHFNESILEGCQKALASSSTPPHKCIEAMAAMVFLRGITSKALLDEFLQLRERSLKEYLRNQKSQSAKAYIGHTLVSIGSFLSTIHKAFVIHEGECCDLELLLQSLSSNPTLSLYQSSGFSAFSSPVMKHLPAIIRDFSPKVVAVDAEAKAKQQIDPEHMKNSCTRWLDSIHDDISENTSAILEHVNSIPALSKIRRGIYDRMKSDFAGLNWDQLCLDTLSRKIVLWDEYYRNLFLDRVELLIETRMKESVQIVINDLNDWKTNPALKDDSFKFIWSEAGLNDLSGGKTSAETSHLLLMKTKAYSPSIQTTCQRLNDSLKNLMNELLDYVNIKRGNAKSEFVVADPMAFLSGPGSEPGLELEPFSLTVDNETILKFAQKSCIDSMMSMVQDIGKEGSPNPIDQGRLFQAMTELCPAIQDCVETTSLADRTKTDSRSVTFSRSSPEWTNMKKLLEEESNRYFASWIEQLVSNLRSNVSCYLTDNAALHMLAEWDMTEIAEEGEDGAQVCSVIRVPQYISIGLHSALSAMVGRVNMVGPHALPQSVQMALSQKAASVIIETYNHYSEHHKLIQNLSLQLHFDTQVMLQSMISRDNKSLTTLCSKTLTSLERHIDPFDLSVFTPYMHENVKKCVLRTQTLFGILIPSDRFALLSSLKAALSSTGSSDQQQQHNVIRMSSLTSRFPLLPVSSIASGPGQQRRGRPKEPFLPAPSQTGSRGALAVQPSSRSSSSSSNRKRSKSPAAKSTTSFFTSMSSTWFGGK